MLPTYKAILKDDRLEWRGDRPLQNEAVLVHVTVLEDASEAASRGPRMAATLERIAEAGGVAAIPHPEAWQHDQRDERALPGRDH